MLSKSKFLKTAVIAALVGLAGVASIAPASAREHDRNGSYHRDRDSGWGRDNGHRGANRHDRNDHDGWGWRHRHHRHHGWY